MPSPTSPISRSPIAPGEPRPGSTLLADHSLHPTWRLFGHVVPVGTAERRDAGLVWSVSPGEATWLGPTPRDDEAIDLTHVRAVISLTGLAACPLLAKLCHLDLSRLGSGRAARTRVAGTATEVVHIDDRWLLVASSSFAGWLWETLLAAGAELDLGTAPADHERVIP